MAALEIACPQCGGKLRLPDRAMLGRKGRCAKCGHKFILALPAEGAAVRPAESPLPVVVFKSADPPPDDEAPVGIGARWVNETAPAPSASQADPPRRGTAAAGVAEGPVLEMLSAVSAEDDLAAARLKSRLRGSRRRSGIVAGILAVLIIAVGIGGYLSFTGGAGDKSAKNGKAASRGAQRPAGDQDEEPAKPKGQVAAGREPADPISLQFVPEGARIVIHLRPAELWQNGGSAEEFRACLGPLAATIEAAIERYSLLKPPQVEEMLFALIPVSRDTFDVAVVVRSVRDLKKSELVAGFGGEMLETPRPHFVGAERAWMILDLRTFAGAPKAMVQSLLEAADAPGVTSEGVEALLLKTDRGRQFTLVCEREDVRLGLQTLVPEKAQGLLAAAVDFFGEDVETVSWSFDLGDEESGTPFLSTVNIRNRLTRSAPKLQADLQKRLAALPADVLQLVRRTRPQRVGEKKIVGRFPIMTKVVERSARFSTRNRLVSLELELPERAGPNLALGSLLTWDQTTRSDFNRNAPEPAAPAASPTDAAQSIAERLKKRITVEFKKEALENAVAFIATEIGVSIKLDGPGMKEGGVTQNEPETFTMEDAPAAAVLARIFAKPNRELVLIVDERKKLATVTSLAFATRKNLKAHPLDSAAP